MSKQKFDAEAFFSALDSHRQSRRLTWKKVADEAGVSASTLTRMAQGKRPDVDSLTALMAWSGLNAESFLHSEQRVSDPLAQITTYLRADPNLSSEAVTAIETTVKVLYERLRGDPDT